MRFRGDAQGQLAVCGRWQLVGAHFAALQSRFLTSCIRKPKFHYADFPDRTGKFRGRRRNGIWAIHSAAQTDHRYYRRFFRRRRPVRFRAFRRGDDPSCAGVTRANVNAFRWHQSVIKSRHSAGRPAGGVKLAPAAHFLVAAGRSCVTGTGGA